MSLKGKKILLVDDDSDLRKIARHILESAGMIVDEAESVYEGRGKNSKLRCSVFFRNG